MITAFVPKNGGIERIEVGPDDQLPASAVWIDLLGPNAAETARVQASLGVALPTRDEMREIEPSSRLYVENEASYMTAQVLSCWPAAP
jgi:magnesium transporter